MKKFSCLLIAVLLIIISGCTNNQTTKTKATKQTTVSRQMEIKINDTTLEATLENNSSADAFIALLEDGPLTLTMSDYANMEKNANLDVSLPENNEHLNTQAGDIILYQGKTLVIYYDRNSWNLTPLGKINNIDAKSLKELLGTGDVTVTFSLKQNK